LRGIAPIAIAQTEETGNAVRAVAMRLLLLRINALVRVLHEVTVKLIERRTNRKEKMYA
jgi:hypothetical protein